MINVEFLILKVNKNIFTLQNMNPFAFPDILSFQMPDF
jgi:hypothetical protein